MFFESISYFSLRVFTSVLSVRFFSIRKSAKQAFSLKDSKFKRFSQKMPKGKVFSKKQYGGVGRRFRFKHFKSYRRGRPWRSRRQPYFFSKGGKFYNFITNRSLRVYDSILNRRLKILRRLRKVEPSVLSVSFKRYSGIRWVRNFKLVRGLLKYRNMLYSKQSQGLKRKVIRRRLSYYAVCLFDKQKIKLFYLGLKENKLRQIVRYSILSRYGHINSFVSSLESRLGTFVFRTNMWPGVFASNKAIVQGKIFVNGEVATNIGLRLNVGDIIKFADSPEIKFYIRNNKKKFRKRFSLFFYPSSYMEVSFSLLKFCFYRLPKLEDVPMFFNVNFSRVLAFYSQIGLK